MQVLKPTAQKGEKSQCIPRCQNTLPCFLNVIPAQVHRPILPMRGTCLARNIEHLAYRILKRPPRALSVGSLIDSSILHLCGTAANHESSEIILTQMKNVLGLSMEYDDLIKGCRFENNYSSCNFKHCPRL